MHFCNIIPAVAGPQLNSSCEIQIDLLQVAVHFSRIEQCVTEVPSHFFIILQHTEFLTGL